MSALTKNQTLLLRSLRSRHGRRDAAFCLCDGLRAGSEILALRPDLVELVILRSGVVFDLPAAIVPVSLDASEFHALAPTVNSQGILVLAKRPAPLSDDAPLSDPFVLVLDRIGDPGNMGTIFRTARAVGLHDVWVTKGSADPFSDKVLRAASGSQFALNIRVAESLSELRPTLEALGIRRFYRTLPAGGENLFSAASLFHNSAIILGCEASGVGALEDSHALHIPMPGGTESLNVAQAATVILFDFVRRTTT